MEEKATVKEQVESTSTVHAIEHTDSELYKIGIFTTAAFAAIVGAWGLVCLLSAVLQNGGPVEMIKNLFQAITGM